MWAAHREHVAQEARSGPVRDPDEPVVVAEHVAELDEQALLPRARDYRLEPRVVVAGRLVVEDVLSGGDDLLCVAEALQVGALRRYGGNAVVLEHLRLVVQPAHLRPGGLAGRLELAAPGGVGLVEADHLHVRVRQHDAQDPGRVAVLGPVLRHPNSL